VLFLLYDPYLPELISAFWLNSAFITRHLFSPLSLKKIVVSKNDFGTLVVLLRKFKVCKANIEN